MSVTEFIVGSVQYSLHLLLMFVSRPPFLLFTTASLISASPRKRTAVLSAVFVRKLSSTAEALYRLHSRTYAASSARAHRPYPRASQAETASTAWSVPKRWCPLLCCVQVRSAKTPLNSLMLTATTAVIFLTLSVWEIAT